jgi:hypothetical protein
MAITGVECIRPDATFDSLPYVPGHSLPKWAVHPMSAFPPIAAKLRTSLMVRFVPYPDSCTAANSSLAGSPEVESFRGPLVSRLGAIRRFEISCQAFSSPSRALASFKSRVSNPSVNQP